MAKAPRALPAMRPTSRERCSVISLSFARKARGRHPRVLTAEIVELANTLPHEDLASTDGNRHSSLGSARPTNPNRARRGSESEHLYCSILRPEPRPALDLAHRSHSIAVYQSQLRTDPVWVRGRSLHAN